MLCRNNKSVGLLGSYKCHLGRYADTAVAPLRLVSYIISREFTIHSSDERNQLDGSLA